MQSKWKTFNARKSPKKSRYLIQQTVEPIQSSLISSDITGKGALDEFEVKLGTRNSILKTLGIPDQSNQNGLLESLGGLAGSNTNNNLLGLLGGLSSLAGRNKNNLNNLSTIANLSKLASSNTSNTGLLSSLFSMASYKIYL